MQAVDVVYFVEHMPREFDVACAVNVRARDLSIYIAPLQDADTVTKTFLPHVAVLPATYALNREHAPPSLQMIVNRWQNAAIIDLAYEQFLSAADQEQRAPRGPLLRNTIYHQAWGSFYADYLTSHEVDADRIRINGNPAYGLYQEPYNRFYPTREWLANKYDLDPNTTWILFPEHYWWAFTSFENLEEYAINGLSLDFVEEQREFHSRSLIEVMQWWAKMSRMHPFEIILRPQPAISAAQYRVRTQEIVGRLPAHLHIIKEGTDKEWIMAADYVFSSTSTALLEAALVRKPAYIIKPFAFPDHEEAEWLDLFPELYSYDDVEQVLLAEPEPVGISATNYVDRQTLRNRDPIEGLAAILTELRQLTPEPATFQKFEVDQTQPSDRFAVEGDRFKPADVAANMQRWQRVIAAE